MDHPQNKIIGGSICTKRKCEVNNRVTKFLLVFVDALSPDLLFLKRVSTIAVYFEMGAQHCHVDGNTRRFMNLLLQASCVDGAEGKEGVNQLAILKKIVKTNNKILKRVGIQQLDGCLDNNPGEPVNVLVQFGMSDLLWHG